MARPGTFLPCVAIALLTACGPSTPKRYSLHGRVLAKSGLEITVSHDEIGGFMPAMTMAYGVKNPREAGQTEPGDVITADLVVDAKKNSWLEHLVVTDRSGRDSLPSVTSDEDLVPGAEIPDVQLTNQDGRTVHLSQFRGKAVLVTFIYTRCPFPNFCPLLSNEFAAIHRELAETPADYRRTHLVSISLDPAFDRPPVLRKYGLTYLHNDPSGFEHWDFAVTSPQDLKQLADAFALTYYEENHQITHNLRTVLLGPDGKVANVWPGNEYRRQELVDAMKIAAAGAKP